MEIGSDDMSEFEDQFYCVGCARMKPIKQADAIFRTGFFRNILPMGYCRECSVLIPIVEELYQMPMNQKIENLHSTEFM